MYEIRTSAHHQAAEPRGRLGVGPRAGLAARGRPRRRPSDERPLGTPEAVLELLAAVDGRTRPPTARRYAAEAGAVLALTHHCEAEILSASIEVTGELSPTAVLDARPPPQRAS